MSTVTHAAGEGKSVGANACKGQGSSALTKENWDVAKESICRPDDGRIEARCRPGLVSMLG